MKKEVVVLSLGGSLIIPDHIDFVFLRKFKKILQKHTKRYKFVIACGGGITARKYIFGIEKENIPKKRFHQGLLGIASTRLNARFMTYFFGNDANKGIPHDMIEVRNMLKIHDIVFCGALRYAENETSDGTAAKLANYFKTKFINLTNIRGLYTKNPKEHANAKFIPEITWNEFNEMAKKIEFKPGQHFVLDQKAAKIIKKYKIPTYILGQDLKNLDAVLREKDFVGTLIKG